MAEHESDLQEAEELERKALWALLVINGVMFFVVAGAGFWADSTALLADSLDNLADASVYGVALYVVGRSLRLKAHVGILSGLLLLGMSIGILLETARRFFYGSEPASLLMILFGMLALLANMTCAFIASRHRQGEVHMRASWIFALNDVFANIGVIASGVLVMFFESRFPDLILGAVISCVVAFGGVNILREGLAAKESK